MTTAPVKPAAPASTRTPAGARRWVVTFTLFWLATVPFDRAIAVGIHFRKVDIFLKGSWAAEAMKLPGFFGFSGPLVLVLALLGLLRWRQAGVALLAMVLSGANFLFKWVVGRMRPYRFPGPDQPRAYTLQPFWHGLNGLFRERDLSFPSGHACVAAALVVSLVAVRPRWRWLLGVALCTGIERVAENAHYASDVVAGFAVGAAAAWLARRLWPAYEPDLQSQSKP